MIKKMAYHVMIKYQISLNNCIYKYTKKAYQILF